MPLPNFRLFLVTLLAASAVHALGSDTPEDAVRALEQAYLQRNADAAVAALDFLEEGRQMLQETNPLMADDPDAVKQAATLLEQSFRSDLRTKGFPDYGKLKCVFAAKAPISPDIIKLTEQCVLPEGGQWDHDVLVMRRDNRWRVVLVPPVF
jgi:hypothetical protein